jgi:predicted DsbA family dithiol-disulfide isomerase
MAPPRLRVWSDYICPYCYVGLGRARGLESTYGAQVDWRPFDLHPEYPPDGISRESLDRKYGGQRWREGLWAMFDAAGLPWTEDVEIVPNSRKALRLGEHARAQGRFEALHPRLFDAYWARGLDLGDDAVLLGEARAAGLDEDGVREVLATDAHLDEVERQTAAALAHGVTGVPGWIVDDRLRISGAAPPEVFDGALAQLGHAPAEGAQR